MKRFGKLPLVLSLVVAGIATAGTSVRASDCDAVARDPFRSDVAPQFYSVSGNGGMFCEDATVTTVVTFVSFSGVPLGEMSGAGTKSAFATAITGCPSIEASRTTTATGAGLSAAHNDNDSETSGAVTIDCSINVTPPGP